MPDRQSSRVALLVLGMHRSGTSAIAHALNLLGAGLPKTVLGGGLGNAQGHWESAALVQLHDEMLAAAGSNWADWRRIDAGTLEKWRSRLIAAFESEFSGQDLLVFKDPRVCRFAGLYLSIFETMELQTVAVHVFRHPFAVADSLAKRNGYSRSFSSLVWLRHMLDAERATRSVRRTFISYEDFVANWRDELALLERHAEISIPVSSTQVEASIDRQVSPELSHHVYERGSIDRSSVLNEWLARTYRAFEQLREDPKNLAAQFTLDNLAKDFDRVAEPFGDAMFSEMARLERELDRLRQVESLHNAADGDR